MPRSSNLTLLLAQTNPDPKELENAIIKHQNQVGHLDQQISQLMSKAPKVLYKLERSGFHLQFDTNLIFPDDMLAADAFIKVIKHRWRYFPECFYETFSEYSIQSHFTVAPILLAFDNFTQFKRYPWALAAALADIENTPDSEHPYIKKVIAQLAKKYNLVKQKKKLRDSVMNFLKKHAEPFKYALYSENHDLLRDHLNDTKPVPFTSKLASILRRKVLPLDELMKYAQLQTCIYEKANYTKDTIVFILPLQSGFGDLVCVQQFTTQIARINPNVKIHIFAYTDDDQQLLPQFKLPAKTTLSVETSLFDILGNHAARKVFAKAQKVFFGPTYFCVENEAQQFIELIAPKIERFSEYNLVPQTDTPKPVIPLGLGKKQQGVFFNYHIKHKNITIPHKGRKLLLKPNTQDYRIILSYYSNEFVAQEAIAIFCHIKATALIIRVYAHFSEQPLIIFTKMEQDDFTNGVLERCTNHTHTTEYYQNNQIQKTVSHEGRLNLFAHNMFPIPQEQMHTLRHISQPLTIATGDQSFIQALAHGKLVIYQCMSWKVDLFLKLIKICRKLKGEDSFIFRFYQMQLMQNDELASESDIEARYNDLEKLIIENYNALIEQANELSEHLKEHHNIERNIDRILGEAGEQKSPQMA